MMYVAGLSYKIIAGILGVAIPLVIVAFILITQTDIKIIDSYQKRQNHVLDVPGRRDLQR